MRVVIEPSGLAAHAIDLYQGQPLQAAADAGVAPVFDSWASALTDEAIAKYHEAGFMVVRGGIDSELSTQARTELQELALADNEELAARLGEIYFEGSIRDGISEADLAAAGQLSASDLAKGSVADHVPNVPAAKRAPHVRKFMSFVDKAKNEGLTAVARHEQLLAVLQSILSAKPQLFQDMAMIKPGKGGREKPWHQDHAYFNLAGGQRVCGVWIALTATDADNGCMYVAPGGHTGGPLPHWKRRDWQICDTDVYDFSRVVVEMNEGDVLIFDGKLPHGTPTNKSDRQRFALQFHYFAEGTSFLDNDTERLALFGSEGKNVYC